MKPGQYFTRIICIVFTVIGVMGFIAAFIHRYPNGIPQDIVARL